MESGKLKSGVMYECVKNNVPFVLAGSLRDDGPLPDLPVHDGGHYVSILEMARKDVRLMLESALFTEAAA